MKCELLDAEEEEDDSYVHYKYVDIIELFSFYGKKIFLSF